MGDQSHRGSTCILTDDTYDTQSGTNKLVVDAKSHGAVNGTSNGSDLVNCTIHRNGLVTGTQTRYDLFNGTSHGTDNCTKHGANYVYGTSDENGLVNGANKENGLVNGTIKEHGLINGTSSKEIGLVNGTNEDNCLVNGIRKENGLVNGTSKENGSVNGAHHGVSNGTQHRVFTNGIRDIDGEEESHQFLERMTNFMLEHARKSSSRNSKVVNFKYPSELKTILDLDVGAEGSDDDRLMELVREICGYAVNTSHPHFFNQLFAGADEYATAGACLTEVLNISQYTYEVATVFTIIEEYVLKKMMSFIGFKDGEGMFCPGGSMSNIFSVHLARSHLFPELRERGLRDGPRLCMFTSDQSHYSITKTAFFLGFGTENLVLVPSDIRARMIPKQLEKAIVEAKQQGKTPFYVNATAGTTVVGAYDPLNEIADICERHGIWMHTDACWGGGAMVSSHQRHRCDGIHRADSVAWNPHKLLGVPLQCCGLMTKHKGLLKTANRANAHYLFQQDKFYDVHYDTGDATVQCSRKVDALKFWLSWKAHGDNGLENRINTIWDNAHYLAEKIKISEGFRLIYEPECTNVCFYYIPLSMRGQRETPEWWQSLSQVAPQVKKRMILKGSIMITYTPNKDWVNFFRMVVINPRTTHQDMDFVLEEIERLAQDLQKVKVAATGCKCQGH